ncbi:hypothetical protein ABES02_29805, partial [Neobacillus pocheonensis]|uniref:hypothetical protein n=1 Tax=Neobacillus pocheonensis TaxID=363869 RepID=UPI003D27C8D2
ASRLPAGSGICSSSPKGFRSSPLGLEPQANPDFRLKQKSQEEREWFSMMVAEIAKVEIGKTRTADEFYDALLMEAMFNDARLGIYLDWLHEQKEAAAHV